MDYQHTPPIGTYYVHDRQNFLRDEVTRAIKLLNPLIKVIGEDFLAGEVEIYTVTLQIYNIFYSASATQDFKKDVDGNYITKRKNKRLTGGDIAWTDVYLKEGIIEKNSIKRSMERAHYDFKRIILNSLDDKMLSLAMAILTAGFRDPPVSKVIFADDQEISPKKFEIKYHV